MTGLPSILRAARVRLLLGLAIFMTALVTPAASVVVTLDRDTIGLGDSATLKVIIEGGTGNEAPRIPEVPGLRLSPAGRGSRFEFSQGRQRSYIELSYLVSASRVGEFTIGPVIVTVDNERLESEPLQLTVVKAGDPAAARSDGLEDAAFLFLKTPERDVYVGETFVLEIWLYAIGGELVQAPQVSADGFTTGQLQSAGQESNIRTNNRIYSRARFVLPLTAARSGDLTVQATDCVLAIPLSRRRSIADIFDSGFFGLQKRRFNLGTEPASIRVLPLPQANVPQGFSGAVGEFDIQLRAAPTTLQAGDPMTVRVAIQGRGNFDSVQLPDPPGWNGFRLYPPTSTFENQDALGLTGIKHFEQVVTPESTNITELPQLAFTFFSPETRGYRTVRTAPVPLEVTAPAALGVRLPEPATPEPDEGASEPVAAPLKPHLGTISPALATPPTRWLLLFSGIPWAAWAGIRAWHQQRTRTGADREARQRRLIEQRLNDGFSLLATQAQNGDAAAFFATLFRTLQEMVGARIQQPAASITEGALDVELPRRGVTAETIAVLHRLFQACNQARYANAGGRVDLEGLRREAESVRSQLVRTD